MSSTSCYTIKVIEETSTNVAVLPSHLITTSTNFQINYIKISTQILT
jgi:hypothetical protein